MCSQESKIIVFTGSGKGKTTAALGLAVSAAMNQQKTVVVQFLKGGGYTGELFAAQHLMPYFTIRQFGYGCPIALEIKAGTKKCTKCGLCFRENRNPANGYAEEAWLYAQRTVTDGKVEFLVLDEISHALKHQLIPESSVLELLSVKPANLVMVLTGRNMPECILKLADQVTVCQAIKHPMTGGIDARRGIEY